MNEGSQRQRLAAILAADAVGYSRLMGADERATAAALDTAHAVFRRHVDAHQGRVVNTVGDSVLAAFETAAGAVVAALAIQRDLDESSRDVPDEHRLRFRIGVHLGDVVEKADGDIYGDGVNIAARLQAIAPPDGVVVSEAVRGAAKSRVAAVFDDLGPQAVKNIAEPVRAYSVRAADSNAMAGAGPASPSRPAKRNLAVVVGIGAVMVASVAVVVLMRPPGAPTPPATAPSTPPASPAAPAAVPAPAGKPSIAVLPFDNMSGDAQQSYFADGITEDLITDLSKVGGLVVIARNSTFAYKGKAQDVRAIAKALGVRYVLEGSVRRSGDDIRVNAQLIDGATGSHLWADRYDGSMKNIFGLQDTVTKNVVAALSVTLTSDDKARVASRGTANAMAYDVFLQGWQHYLRQTPDEYRAAIADFRKAAEIDPDYGRAYAALAATYWEAYSRYWGAVIGLGPHPHETLYGAEQYLAKAMRAPTPLAHQVASAMLVHSQRLDEAIAEAKRAIAADPNDADGHVALARALSFAGRPGEALEAVERAMRLNPIFPSSYEYQRGLAQFGLDRLTEAAASLEHAVAMNGDDYWSQRLLLAIYGLLGRKDDAARTAEMVRKSLKNERDPLSIKAVAFWYPFAKADDASRFATGLRKAGVPE